MGWNVWLDELGWPWTWCIDCWLSGLRWSCEVTKLRRNTVTRFEVPYGKH